MHAKLRVMVLALTVGSFHLGVDNGTTQPDPKLILRAKALHKQSPLIDGHNDYPWALRERDVGGDFNKADITEPVPSLMTDIPRLRRGAAAGCRSSATAPVR